MLVTLDVDPWTLRAIFERMN